MTTRNRGESYYWRTKSYLRNVFFVFTDHLNYISLS